MGPHLNLNQETIIEGSSQDKVTRRPDQELVPLSLRHSSDGSILIRHLKAHMKGVINSNFTVAIIVACSSLNMYFSLYSFTLIQKVSRKN